jgi:mannose-6-phosphate isomerase-like protein (cupin superfamily)
MNPPATPPADGAGSDKYAPRAPVNVISFDSVPEMEAHALGAEGPSTDQALLSTVLSSTPDLLCDRITFGPGFIHHMHRHFDADQVMIPLSGSVVMIDADGTETPLGVGQLAVIPRFNWHETRNVSDEPCVVLNLFGGAGDNQGVGFEARDPRYG